LNQKFEYFIIVILTFIITGCNNIKYENKRILKTYSKKGHYGYDKIFFRVDNKFTRTNGLLPFSKKEFYGSYLETNDSIFLDYEKRKPDDELLFFTKETPEQIKVFQIYESWDYDTITKESKIMILDTAEIKYNKIK
jgi:hypothetical protein